MRRTARLVLRCQGGRVGVAPEARSSRAFARKRAPTGGLRPRSRDAPPLWERPWSRTLSRASALPQAGCACGAATRHPCASDSPSCTSDALSLWERCPTPVGATLVANAFARKRAPTGGVRLRSRDVPPVWERRSILCKRRPIPVEASLVANAFARKRAPTGAGAREARRAAMWKRPRSRLLLRTSSRGATTPCPSARVGNRRRRYAGRRGGACTRPPSFIYQ